MTDDERRQEAAPDCARFRPDHNGECLDCDEWIDAHTPAAIEAGARAERRRTGMLDKPRKLKKAALKWIAGRRLTRRERDRLLRGFNVERRRVRFPPLRRQPDGRVFLLDLP